MSDEAMKAALSGVNVDPNLPHYEIRIFIVTRMRGDPDEAFNRDFARLVGLPEGPDYGGDLNAIVSVLNAGSYWWHLSHLEAVVIPTKPAPGLEGLVSNGMMYDREGQPIEYRADFAREHPALKLCEALIKATYDLPTAFAVQASAREEAWAKEPATREHMMLYYEARENLRQRSIQTIKDSTEQNQ